MKKIAEIFHFECAHGKAYNPREQVCIFLLYVLFILFYFIFDLFLRYLFFLIFDLTVLGKSGEV